MIYPRQVSELAASTPSSDSQPVNTSLVDIQEIIPTLPSSDQSQPSSSPSSDTVLMDRLLKQHKDALGRVSEALTRVEIQRVRGEQRAIKV